MEEAHHETSAGQLGELSYSDPQLDCVSVGLLPDLRELQTDLMDVGTEAWFNMGKMVASASGVSNFLSWCQTCIGKGLESVGDVLLPHRWYHKELTTALQRLEHIEKELQQLRSERINPVCANDLLIQSTSSRCGCAHSQQEHLEMWERSLNLLTPTGTVPQAPAAPPAPPPPPPPPPLPSANPAAFLAKKKRANNTNRVSLPESQSGLVITAEEIKNVTLRKTRSRPPGSSDKRALRNTQLPIQLEDIQRIKLRKSGIFTTVDGVDKENYDIQESITAEVPTFKRKLRKTGISRSPGGTPLFSKKRRRESGQGLTPIMTRALKKKFRGTKSSPSSNDSSPSSVNTSAASSPVSPEWASGDDSSYVHHSGSNVSTNLSIMSPLASTTDQ